MGKKGDFQTYFRELIELEDKQFQVKKALTTFNKPSKTKKKESIVEVIDTVLNENGFDLITENLSESDLKQLIDKYIQNDTYYDENHDRILESFKSILNEIKGSFFMTDETRELLQYKFNKIRETQSKIRDICIFNLCVFSIFIYKYESNNVMISQIGEYLKSNNIEYKHVPDYENTFKYDFEYDKFTFFNKN